MTAPTGGPSPACVQRHGLDAISILKDRKVMYSACPDFLQWAADRKFGAILADPPWQFQNKTGKV